jgi:DNA modification methylase
MALIFCGVSMDYEKFKVSGGTIFRGNCLDVMRDMPDCSVDGACLDPPYGLSKEPNIVEVLTHWLAGDRYEHNGAGFMNKSWDSFVPGPEVWKELYRVMKPGAFALIFSGTRTWDLMGIALRLGGFSIKETCMWLYSSGFPKSMNISAKIDQKLGLEREVIGKRKHPTLSDTSSDLRQEQNQFHAGNSLKDEWDVTAPASEEATDWSGFGTALKPAWEPIIIAQKPLEGTYVNNILKHGVGALNIDACRVSAPKDYVKDRDVGLGQGFDAPNKTYGKGFGGVVSAPHPTGRFPANLVLQHSPACVKLGSKKIKGSGTSKTFHEGYEGDSTTGFVRGVSHPGNQHADPDGTETIEEYSCVQDCPIHLLNEQAGIRPGCKSPSKAKPSSKFRPEQGNYMPQGPIYGDTGYASRFFLNLDGEEVEIPADSENWKCVEDCPVRLLDEQSGNVSYGKKEGGYSYTDKEYEVEGFVKSCKPKAPSNYGDEGGASRFFLNIEGEEWDCVEDCPIKLLRDQSGITKSGRMEPHHKRRTPRMGHGGVYGNDAGDPESAFKGKSGGGDSGYADRFFLNLEGEEPPTRFFYCGKASRKERSSFNTHPTVKPLKLLEYLVKLITPPKPGIILDPFSGSGSTLLACKNLGVPFIGIELESEYVEIAKKRLEDSNG